MKRMANLIAGIFGMMCLLGTTNVRAQNDVYKNTLIGVVIRWEGSEGGYDWAFVKALPNYTVSFTYQGKQVTLSGMTGQRFIRKDHPIPQGFKLTDSQVMVDGYPATNYNNYMSYYNTLYEANNNIFKEANRNDKQSLLSVIKKIDSKIAEINSKMQSFQVSSSFRNQYDMDKYIKRLEDQRKSYEKDISLIEKKESETKVIITGNSKSTSSSKSSSSGTSAEAVSLGGSSSGATPATGPTTATTKNEDIRAASSFQGGLSNIKEGEVFKNDRGEYFQKVNGGARKVDKSAYDRVEANRIAAQLANQEAERQERDAVYSRATEDLTNLGANVLMGMRADREARLDRAYAAQSRADEAIKAYGELAADGNIEALKKVNNAYHTLAFYNKEEKGGWKGKYSKAREAFLKNTLEKTNNSGARDLLLGFYDTQKEQAMARRRKGIYRAIAYPLLGAGLAYGGYKVYDSILNDDDDGSMEWLGTTMLSIGVVGGIAFGGWGLFEGASVFGRGKSSEYYKEADRKQQQILRRYAWRLTPKYNTRLHASLLSLNITF